MVGINVETPKETCSDPRCPFHGKLSVRGRILEGMVVGDKMSHTVTVDMEKFHLIRRYERYERRTSKIHAHNPPCINAKAGDKVKIMECRRISKTKSFVVVEKLGG
jgi:small subunit ribosomal protein S17